MLCLVLSVLSNDKRLNTFALDKKVVICKFLLPIHTFYCNSKRRHCANCSIIVNVLSHYKIEKINEGSFILKHKERMTWMHESWRVPSILIRVLLPNAIPYTRLFHRLFCMRAWYSPFDFFHVTWVRNGVNPPRGENEQGPNETRKQCSVCGSGEHFLLILTRTVHTLFLTTRIGWLNYCFVCKSC